MIMIKGDDLFLVQSKKKEMKRRDVLESLVKGLVIGGAGVGVGAGWRKMFGGGRDGDCEKVDVYFVKVPVGYGRKRMDELVVNLNKSFEKEGIRFVVFGFENCINIEVVKVKGMEVNDYEGVVKELRKDFLVDKKS